LAWDISVALEKPVLAIVPGYGVADLVLQGLVGWFAFGLHDFLSSKTLIQAGLATAAPETACIGRELAASTPQEPTARGGASIFRYGSGSSDVLHALLEHREGSPIFISDFFGETPSQKNPRYWSHINQGSQTRKRIHRPASNESARPASEDHGPAIGHLCCARPTPPGDPLDFSDTPQGACGRGRCWRHLQDVLLH